LRFLCENKVPRAVIFQCRENIHAAKAVVFPEHGQYIRIRYIESLAEEALTDVGQ